MPRAINQIERGRFVVCALVLLVASEGASAFSECGVLEQQGSCLMFRSDSNVLYELLPRADGFEPGDRVRVLGNEELDCPLTCPIGDGCITNARLSGCHPVCTSSATITEAAEFALGNTVNLNWSLDELRINTWTQTESANPPVLPYIWVAASGHNTVVRIATEDHTSPFTGQPVQAGDILGEYRTAPDDCATTGDSFTDPSRATVDFDGNVWVANRMDIDHDTMESCEVEDPKTCGHVVKIGSGLSFQWIDRNCNGRLDTSTGLGDIRPWRNPDGICNAFDVQFAEDELILLYQPVQATGTRTVAVDRNNNVWVAKVETELCCRCVWVRI